MTSNRSAMAKHYGCFEISVLGEFIERVLVTRHASFDTCGPTLGPH